MKKVLIALFSASSLLVSFSAYAKEQPQQYLADFVAKQPYKTMWSNGIWKNVKNKKNKSFSWLNKAQGVTSPVETVFIGKGKYGRSTICEPHNCMDNRAYVLITSHKIAGIQFKKRNNSNVTDTYSYGNLTKDERDYLVNWKKSED